MKKIRNFIKNKIPFSKFIYKQIIFFCQYSQYLIVIKRQKKVYKKLCIIAKQNKRKMKIVFLVNENEKWCCQNLYDKLKQSKSFEPVIFLTSLNDFKRKDIDEKYNKNIEFFYKHCDNVQLVYDNKTKCFDNLKKYNPDIVIYQQPWGMAKNQNIFSISKFALAIYIPYTFVEEKEIIEKFKYVFHYNLFREYIPHELVKKEYPSKDYATKNLKVVGYPKLEQYLDSKKYEKKYIIYAPHHSVSEESIKLGTFDWNGKFILEYAKKHSEFNWIFKPHPFCKHSFIRAKIFKNIKEINTYYDEWSKIGTIYDKGNYIDLFKQTKCLITDCASFLVEFLPTEAPVINLKRKDSIYAPQIINKITKSYYQIYNIEELKKVFKDVLENDKDIKKQERLNLIKELNLVKKASDNIIKDLQESFYKK